MHTVFVYGTLRKGGSNHFRLAGAEFIGMGKVSGAIHLIDSHPDLVFPALKLDMEGHVVGEVFRVSETLLKSLDAYEGISERFEEPYEYRRVRVEIEMETGGSVSAWVWEWNSVLGGGKPLPEGDWLLYEPNPS